MPSNALEGVAMQDFVQTEGDYDVMIGVKKSAVFSTDLVLLADQYDRKSREAQSMPHWSFIVREIISPIPGSSSEFNNSRSDK